MRPTTVVSLILYTTVWMIDRSAEMEMLRLKSLLVVEGRHSNGWMIDRRWKSLLVVEGRLSNGSRVDLSTEMEMLRWKSLLAEELLFDGANTSAGLPPLTTKVAEFITTAAG